MRLLFLALTLCLVGCASVEPVPDLKNRDLKICDDDPCFKYDYEVCTRYFLGSCTRTEMQTDYYDMTDPTMRRRLKDMSFTLTVDDNLP